MSNFEHKYLGWKKLLKKRDLFGPNIFGFEMLIKITNSYSSQVTHAQIGVENLQGGPHVALVRVQTTVRQAQLAVVRLAMQGQTEAADTDHAPHSSLKGIHTYKERA